MLAMQYTFTLPADYDMDIIRQRVTTKGPAVDGFPGLGFKAFLYTRRGDHGPENLYAPFSPPTPCWRNSRVPRPKQRAPLSPRVAR